MEFNLLDLMLFDFVFWKQHKIRGKSIWISEGYTHVDTLATNFGICSDTPRRNSMRRGFNGLD